MIYTDKEIAQMLRDLTPDVKVGDRYILRAAAARLTENGGGSLPATPHQSSPGLRESVDSTNGVSLQRAAGLDETGSGSKVDSPPTSDEARGIPLQPIDAIIQRLPHRLVPLRQALNGDVLAELANRELPHA